MRYSKGDGVTVHSRPPAFHRPTADRTLNIDDRRIRNQAGLDDARPNVSSSGLIARQVVRLGRIGAILIALFAMIDTVAQADPLPTADVGQSAETDDGWHLRVELTKMFINAVPNMAATAVTKEGFVTGQAIATIDGDGEMPVNTGEVILGVQVGCQVDLSGGGSLGISGGAGLGLGGGGVLSGSVNAFIYPNATVTLQPGNIRTIVLGQWSLKGRTGETTVHDAHVKVDGCGGPVPIRFFAYAQIATDHGSDSVNTYADLLNL